MEIDLARGSPDAVHRMMVHLKDKGCTDAEILLIKLFQLAKLLRIFQRRYYRGDKKVLPNCVELSEELDDYLIALEQVINQILRK
jgi:hypothetical protein